MGALIKFLLISFLLFWLGSKLIGFLARVFLGRVAKQNGGRFTYSKSYSHTNKKEEHKTNDGNVHIDHVPKGSKSKEDRFKGGDYIDFEELK